MAYLDILDSNNSSVMTEHDLVFSGKMKLQKKSGPMKLRKEDPEKKEKIVRVGITREQLSELFPDTGEAPEDLLFVFYESSKLSPEEIIKISSLIEISLKQIKAMESLTECELKTLAGLSKNLSYLEISILHFVAFDTVKGHVTNIFRKLGVNNRHKATTIYLAYIAYKLITPVIDH
jgi:DNA-binding CsgD family transcriptional regulator